VPPCEQGRTLTAFLKGRRKKKISVSGSRKKAPSPPGAGGMTACLYSGLEKDPQEEKNPPHFRHCVRKTRRFFAPLSEYKEKAGGASTKNESGKR